MANWDDVPDEGPTSMDWALGFHGNGSGILRQVAFGLGDATRVLVEVSDTEGGGVRLALTCGDAADPTDEGGMDGALEEVATFLEGIVEALRDAKPGLVEGYRAQQEAAAQAPADDDEED